MNNLHRNYIVINALSLALLFVWMPVWAGETAGTVTHLSGPLLAKKQDGTVKILAQKSVVEQGDTLVSEKNTYAQIKFIDKSEITLRPNSQLKIDSFSYDEAKPDGDGAVFNLIKGGLRAVTGLLGKRNSERVNFNTPTATIGIRGTIFIAEYIPSEESSVATYDFVHVAASESSDSLEKFLKKNIPSERVSVSDVQSWPLLAQSVPTTPGTGGLAAGLYVHVIDGVINLTNKGGSQSFSAGQFGYTASIVQPPVVVPANPGIKFTPPPSFSSSSTPQVSSGSAGKSKNVDCEVR